jgi:hypothetical protein
MMTEADYMMSFNDEQNDLSEDPPNPVNCKTFNGNTTAESISTTTLGGGLFMPNPSSPNQIIIVGIVSRLPHPSSTSCNAIFSNIIFFVDWIERCLATLN